MALRVPTGLSPSKVSSFKSCPLAFRFSAIEKLPEKSTIWTTKGTLVHRALELLFCEAPAERTVATALAALARARAEMMEDPDFTDLQLDDVAEARFFAEAEQLVHKYFQLEDPSTIHPIGIELRLDAQIGGVQIRGIIDRLELDEDGGLVVTDYKTGRTPSERDERGRLGGVHFYALLCEQVFGRRPSRVQLLYVAEPVAIIATPSDQSSRFLEKQVAALWSAVERACEREDFRPHPSNLCNYCAFKAYCPSFGGDPTEAYALAAGRTAVEVRVAAPLAG